VLPRGYADLHLYSLGLENCLSFVSEFDHLFWFLYFIYRCTVQLQRTCWQDLMTFGLIIYPGLDLNGILRWEKRRKFSAIGEPDSLIEYLIYYNPQCFPWRIHTMANILNTDRDSGSRVEGITCQRRRKKKERISVTFLLLCTYFLAAATRSTSHLNQKESICK